MIYRIVLLFLGGMLAVSCVPDSNTLLKEISIDVNDPEVRKIIRYEINQQKDSLSQFFYHRDPTYRYLAAKAFASFRTESIVDELDTLLNDPIAEVKGMAAYAMGQIGSSKAEPYLVNAFVSRDTSSVDNIANSRILEAVGKVGSKQMLDAVSTISTYRITDTLLLLGQMKSLYQFGMRDLVSKQGTDKIIEIINLNEYPQKVRLMAAHYLYRVKDLPLEDYKFQLTQAFIKETDVNIKMVLALALGKTVDPEVQNVLLEQLQLDQDYRIKVNIIRALAKQDYIRGAEKILPLLSDDNLTVAQTAADFFVNNGNKDDATVYRNLAREDRHWTVKTRLYTSVLKNLPYYYTKTMNATRWELLTIIEEIEAPYEAAGYINALSYDPGSYSDLIKMLEEEDRIPVKSAIYSGLANIMSDDEFDLTFKGSSRYVKQQILDAFNTAMESGDAGSIAIVGEALASDNDRLIPMIDSTTLIETTMDKLRIPEDIEAFNALERALAKIKGVPDPVLTKLDANFTPDYELLSQFKESKEVIVKTNRGIFNIKLDLNQAPASVMNFIELVNDDYFDNKIFHRVVPNFVIQTGCSRGDGYGSLDYTIRSEVGPSYYNDEGYVGLASAGPDTESAQWFVTHSPTPHLDGKYTIIGKVTSGMEIVHTIQVGDKIEDIILKII